MMRIHLKQPEFSSLRDSLKHVIEAAGSAKCEHLHHDMEDLHQGDDACFPLQRLQDHVAIVKAFSGKLEGE